MSKKRKHRSAEKNAVQNITQQEIQQEIQPAPVPDVQQSAPMTIQKTDKLIEKNPFAQLLGIQILEVREGFAYGRMRFDEHFTNIYSGMHGGCTYALADTMAGVAASTYGNYVTTVDGKMNYLEAVKDTEYIYCEVKVQRQGKTIGVYSAKIWDDNQKLLVTADFTYYRTGEVIPAEI